MDSSPSDTGGRASKPSKSLSAMLWVLGFLAMLVVGFTLEDEVGIPFDTTFRVVCAGACLVFIHKLGRDFPGERWPKISLWIALVVNVGIFFTPLVDRPASRGELVLFALPDAIVVLGALLVERIRSYPVADVHQRAVRQQIILDLVLAIVFCAILFTWALMPPRTGH